jgi:hypothetical protein
MAEAEETMMKSKGQKIEKLPRKSIPETENEPRRGRGRPPLPPGESRPVVLTVRMSMDEADHIRRIAAARGEKLSDFLRSTVLARIVTESRDYPRKPRR